MSCQIVAFTKRLVVFVLSFKKKTIDTFYPITAIYITVLVNAYFVHSINILKPKLYYGPAVKMAYTTVIPFIPFVNSLVSNHKVN